MVFLRNQNVLFSLIAFYLVSCGMEKPTPKQSLSEEQSAKELFSELESKMTLISKDVIDPPSVYYDALIQDRLLKIYENAPFNPMAQEIPKIWLNFEGGSVAYGLDAGKTILSCKAAVEFPAANFTLKEQEEIVGIVKDIFSGIQIPVSISSVKPSSGAFTTIYIGGRYDNLSCGTNADLRGLSVLDRENLNKSDVAFVFSEIVNSTTMVALEIAHQLGHTFGLEHTTSKDDLMYPVHISQLQKFIAAQVQNSKEIQDSVVTMAENIFKTSWKNLKLDFKTLSDPILSAATVKGREGLEQLVALNKLLKEQQKAIAQKDLDQVLNNPELIQIVTQTMPVQSQLLERTKDPQYLSQFAGKEFTQNFLRLLFMTQLINQASKNPDVAKAMQEQVSVPAAAAFTSGFTLPYLSKSFYSASVGGKIAPFSKYDLRNLLSGGGFLKFGFTVGNNPILNTLSNVLTMVLDPTSPLSQGIVVISTLAGFPQVALALTAVQVLVKGIKVIIENNKTAPLPSSAPVVINPGAGGLIPSTLEALKVYLQSGLPDYTSVMGVQDLITQRQLVQLFDYQTAFIQQNYTDKLDSGALLAALAVSFAQQNTIQQKALLSYPAYYYGEQFMFQAGK